VNYDEPPSWGTRWGRSLGIAIAVPLLAAAVVAAVLTATSHLRPAPTVILPPGVSATGLVTRSAQQTLTQRTADMTLSGAVQAQGSTISLQGYGKADFASNSLAVDAVVNLPSGAVSEREVAYSGTRYYSVSVTAKAGTLPVGRSWIQMPAQQSASASIAGSDPLAALHQLGTEGSTVRPIGAKLIGDVPCDGYAVTPRRAPAQALTVWIDSRHLVREEDTPVRMTINGSAAAGSVVMTFGNFGAPVEIVPPAGSDTIAYGAVPNDVGLTSLADLSAPGDSGIGATPPPAG